MRYTYDPHEKQQRLTVQFQDWKIKIPLPILITLFKELTERISNLFIVCGDNSKVKSIINLLQEKEVLSEESPGYGEYLYLKLLLEGDTRGIKCCLDKSHKDLDDDVIEKYAEVYKEIVRIHLANIVAGIILEKGPKGNKLHLWHLIPKDINKENSNEEKEQTSSKDKQLVHDTSFGNNK